MRGNEKAADVLNHMDNIILSAVTYMELIQGMRNKVELSSLETTLTTWKASIFPITEDISDHATSLVKQHFHSHSLMLADALIAATAIINCLY
jgi:predicted nucleic acid-binding protein